MDQSIFMKTMQLTIDHFEKSMSNPGQRKELHQFYKEIEMKLSQEDGVSSDFVVQHYYSKLFHHCMVQGLLQILTSQHSVLASFETPDKNKKTILQKVIKIVFKQG